MNNYTLLIVFLSMRSYKTTLEWQGAKLLVVIFFCLQNTKADDNFNDAISPFFPHSCKTILEEDDDATWCHCCPLHSRKRQQHSAPLLSCSQWKKKRRWQQHRHPFIWNMKKKEMTNSFFTHSYRTTLEEDNDGIWWPLLSSSHKKGRKKDDDNIVWCGCFVCIKTKGQEDNDTIVVIFFAAKDKEEKTITPSLLCFLQQKIEKSRRWWHHCHHLLYSKRR